MAHAFSRETRLVVAQAGEITALAGVVVDDDRVALAVLAAVQLQPVMPASLPT